LSLFYFDDFLVSTQVRVVCHKKLPNSFLEMELGYARSILGLNATTKCNGEINPRSPRVSSCPALNGYVFVLLFLEPCLPFDRMRD
jgi:hypothetical protein